MVALLLATVFGFVVTASFYQRDNRAHSELVFRLKALIGPELLSSVHDKGILEEIRDLDLREKPNIGNGKSNGFSFESRKYAVSGIGISSYCRIIYVDVVPQSKGFSVSWEEGTCWTGIPFF